MRIRQSAARIGLPDAPRMKRFLAATCLVAIANAGCGERALSVTVQNDATTPPVIRIVEATRARSWLVPPLQETTISREQMDAGVLVELLNPADCEVLDQTRSLNQPFGIVVSPQFPSTKLLVHEEQPPIRETFLEPNFDGCR